MSAFWIRLRNAVFAVFFGQLAVVASPALADATTYQGLWWNSPDASESGWGINLAHQGDTIFATWFTYDVSGEGWWLSMTANKSADKTYVGALIETTGPAFGAVPFDPRNVTRTTVGNGTLTFGDADHAIFSYTVKGVSQTKFLVRQAFGRLPTCIYGARHEFAAATNYQDLWWMPNGAESGWGVNLAHQGDVLFGTWFTYDVDGTPLWLSVTAEKMGAGVYGGDLIRTSGPAFSAAPFDPGLVTRTVVGKAVFTFTHGNAATFAYTVGGISQTKTLTRQLFAPPAGTVCFDTFGQLTFDKISLAVFPGAQETISVTATDADGAPVEWTVQSDNAAIAQAVKVGSKINVTGVGLGRTQLTIVSGSNVRRTLPVQVYDPKVLDVGEILISYVDRFACRWNDAGSGASLDGSFYHPVVPAGWQALGSLGVRTYGCANVDRQQWMMIVRADPQDADPANPPLRPPVRYEKEWDDAGTGGDVLFGAFWTPICENGYRAMGTVVTGGRTSAGRNPPPLGDVTCVRSDLTVPAAARTTIWNDKGTGGDVRYQGSFTLEAADNFDYETTTAYLTTGAFVTQGDLRSCSGEGCWSPPALGARTVMNALAVDLPMLIDTPRAATIPALTGYAQPPAQTEPLMAKAMLVPFTAIGSAEHWATRGLDWMVNNSPFVRAERLLRWELEFWQYNTSSAEQNPSKTFTKGITTTDSTSLSHTAGIAISAEGGVQFLGTGGKVSATVSYQFGYESQHSVAEFSEESTRVTINVPAHKAAAAWQAHSEIAVKVHNPATHLLELVHPPIKMPDSLFFITDDYPD